VVAAAELLVGEWDDDMDQAAAYQIVSEAFRDRLGWGCAGKCGFTKYQGFGSAKQFWKACVVKYELTKPQKRHQLRGHKVERFCTNALIPLEPNETLLDHAERCQGQQMVARPAVEVYMYLCGVLLPG